MTISELNVKKEQLTKKVNMLSKEFKTRFSKIDISMPLSEDEKTLSKEIADIYSQINEIIKQKHLILKS